MDPSIREPRNRREWRSRRPSKRRDRDGLHATRSQRNPIIRFFDPRASRLGATNMLLYWAMPRMVVLTLIVVGAAAVIRTLS